MNACYPIKKNFCYYTTKLKKKILQPKKVGVFSYPRNIKMLIILYTIP